MNRPKIGWIVVTAMCSSIAACGAWPTVESGETDVPEKTRTEVKREQPTSQETAQAETKVSGYVRVKGKAGVRQVTVPEGLFADRIEPLASKDGVDEKTYLTAQEAIERVALPEYLLSKQEDGQSHSVVKEASIAAKDASDNKDAVALNDDKTSIKPEDSEFSHLWKGSETLAWADELDGVVDVEIGEVVIPESVTDEPALGAQVAYARGMQALLSRNLSEAKKAFEEALELEPENPSILRQLGWVYSAAGNKAKGAWYFKKVLEFEPDDMQALHIVGRHELDEGNWDTSIALLGKVFKTLEADGQKYDDALLPLTQYYLAAALRQGGYLFAGSEMFEEFLVRPKRISGATTFGRELMFVGRQVGLIWLAAGDMRNQLNEPDVALMLYQQAYKSGVKENEQLVLRVAYTKLRMGDESGAMKAIAALVRNYQNQVATMRVVNWVLEQGCDREDLIDEMLAIYEEREGADEKLAITISEICGDEQGKLLLTEHLRAYPSHDLVYEYLLKEWVFGGKADAKVSHPLSQELRVREGLMICLNAMEGATDKAGQYARFMLREAGDWQVVERVIEGMEERERNRASIQVVYGLSKAAHIDLPSASLAFEKAFEQDPKLMVARLELAKMMVVMRRYDRANELLDDVAEDAQYDSEVTRLKAKMHEQQGKLESAMNAYQAAVDHGNEDVLMLIGKADIQLKMGLLKPCEQTLLDAISKYPKEEQLYDAVFKLYDSRSLELGDMQQRYQRVMARLMGTLPNSRLARMKRGEILTARGDYEASGKLFDELLSDYPRDIELMGRILQMHMRANQSAKAVEFIEGQVEKWPSDLAVLKLAVDYFKTVKDMEKVFVYTEKMIMHEPSGHAREIKLASLYVSWGKDLDAAAVLGRLIEDKALTQPHVVAGMLWSALHRVEMDDQGEVEMRAAMKRFPKHAADIGFQWAILIESTGDKDQGESLMLEVLAAEPNYAPANNQLGYRWVIRGEKLEQAKEMIERAVKAEPENGAYMDSLGWAYYKLGDYAAAVKWLEKATKSAEGEYPVILSHLGDAYWALGKKGDAVRTWEKARLKLENEPGKYTAVQDPELEGLQELLGEKIMKAGE